MKRVPPLPVQSPKVNTGRYQELFEEALERIPVHSPEWTNFNESDPGITLIQLFAWLTEMLLYRANNIPERHRLKFLRIRAHIRKLRCRPRVLIIGGNKSTRSAPARFIAHQLGRELYRIDVSAVVNRYIGETEKNLRRLFDAAGDGGIILFFDEADALFGKRTKEKGTDKGGNQNIPKLQAWLKRYPGLVILGMKRRENPVILDRCPFVIPVKVSAKPRAKPKTRTAR